MRRSSRSCLRGAASVWPGGSSPGWRVAPRPGSPAAPAPGAAVASSGGGSTATSTFRRRSTSTGIASATRGPEPAGAAIRSPLLVVIGSTAVGKSEFALLACERFGGEVLSVDSMQVYRGLDRGTSKPGPGARRRVVHHGIDLEAARTVAPNDRQRLGRALEVVLLSRRGLGERIRESPFGADRYPAIKIGLKMRHDTLYRLIDERVVRFFDDGLVEELRGLLARG